MFTERRLLGLNDVPDRPNLVLIGTSQVGKTRASEYLKDELKYKRYDVDAMVTAVLDTKLTEAGIDKTYGNDTDRTAKYLGNVTEDPQQYSERQEEFVKAEAQVMDEVIAKVRQDIKDGIPFVVDCTGSVVMVPEKLEQLQDLANTTIVHLESSPENAAELTAKFTSDPKPIVWPKEVMDQFLLKGNTKTLEDLYKETIIWRTEQYKKYADKNIPWEQHRPIVEHDPGTLLDLLS